MIFNLDLTASNALSPMSPSHLYTLRSLQAETADSIDSQAVKHIGHSPILFSLFPFSFSLLPFHVLIR